MRRVQRRGVVGTGTMALVKAFILNYEDLRSNQTVLAHRMRDVAAARDTAMGQLKRIRDADLITIAGELRRREVSFRYWEERIETKSISGDG